MNSETSAARQYEKEEARLLMRYLKGGAAGVRQGMTRFSKKGNGNYGNDVDSVAVKKESSVRMPKRSYQNPGRVNAKQAKERRRKGVRIR